MRPAIDTADEVPATRARAVALGRPRRPVWLGELLLAARGPSGDAADGYDDVLAALAVMHDHHEINAVIRNGCGWVPAPQDTVAFIRHIEEALDSLGRDPVAGEVCVILATTDATSQRSA